MRTKIKFTTRKQFLKKLYSVKHLCLIISITRDCVLACPFCYARDPENLPPRQILPDDLLEKVIKEAFGTRHKEITFEWTGGEALLAGREFFEKVLNLQKKYAPKNKSYSNCVQTSGGLYNEKLYDFLIENKIRPSLTIDGPKDLHDLQRPMKCGKSSFDTVIKSYNYIKQKQGRCGFLCTVTKNSLGREKEILQFFRNLGMKSFYSNPYIHDPRKPVKDEDIALTVEEYAGYFINQFNAYLEIDDKNFCPDRIVDFMKQLAGLSYPTKCINTGLCLTSFLNIDPEGNVTLCPKFLGYKAFRFGNVRQTSLKVLLNHKTNKILNSLINQRVAAMNKCEKERCGYLKICNSGCPYHSFLNSNGFKIDNRDIICHGKKELFKYICGKLKDYGIKTVVD